MFEIYNGKSSWGVQEVILGKNSWEMSKKIIWEITPSIFLDELPRVIHKH